MCAQPSGIALATGGAYWVARPGQHVVVKVSAAGRSTTYAGTGQQASTGDGGPATAASLDTPYALAVTGGALYIAETVDAGHIRRVGADGVISSVSRTG